MNKIFNINLGGYPFTIDDDAYTHLSHYLETIHNHFRSSEGYEEITSDIENRMAELFQEEIGEKPIVTLKTVEAAIAVMGTPEEFGAEPMEEAAPKIKGDKSKYQTGKRLFRNSDDEVVGGVCSGVAAYFGVSDPLWIRLLWIVLTLSGGFGIALYIILWIIVPQAETASDRLMMRGENINASNIGKIIEEEMEHFSEKITELGDEFSSKKKGLANLEVMKALREMPLRKGISLLGKVVSVVVKALTTVFTTVLKIWKPIIFIVGLVLIIAFSIGWILAIISFFLALPFAEYFVAGPRFIAYLGTLNIFVVASVPALSLAFFIARLAFNKRMSAHWQAGVWSFWVLNVISLSAIASTQARHFSSANEIIKTLDLSAINSDTLIIDLQQNPYADALFEIGDLKLSDGLLVSDNVRLDVVKSEGQIFEIKQVIHSRGINTEDANVKASVVDYNFNLNGNVIAFPKIFTISKDTKWRGQGVNLTLYVPVGKTIRFENNADYLTEEIDFDDDVERPWLETNQYWLMEDNGLVNKDWAKTNKMSEEYNFTDFSKLQIEGKLKVIVEKGDNFKVSITGKENYIQQIKVAQLEKTLSITTDIQDPSSPIRVYITLPTLESLDIRETDDVNIQGFAQPKMYIKNDGGYDLKAFINVDSLFLVQDGRGEINVRGNGKYLKADLDNYGKIDTERFNVNVAELKAYEFSQASVAVSETIYITKDESSSVNIEGEPQIIESDKKNID